MTPVETPAATPTRSFAKRDYSKAFKALEFEPPAFRKFKQPTRFTPPAYKKPDPTPVAVTPPAAKKPAPTPVAVTPPPVKKPEPTPVTPPARKPVPTPPVRKPAPAPVAVAPKPAPKPAPVPEKVYDTLAPVTQKAYFDIEIDGRPAGRIIFGLFGSTTPKTVKNFATLSQGGSGLTPRGLDLNYEGSIFHRIIPGFMAQGGDYTHSNGSGGYSIYGVSFPDENFILNHDKPFLLSMANSGPDSNGS